METHYKTLLAHTIAVRKLQKTFFKGGSYLGQKYPRKHPFILQLSKDAELVLDDHIKMMLAEMEATKKNPTLFEN
jgi:hypothetical protein